MELATLVFARMMSRVLVAAVVGVVAGVVGSVSFGMAAFGVEK